MTSSQSCSSEDIPKYPQNHKLSIGDADQVRLQNATSHQHDPLGACYRGLEEAVSSIILPELLSVIISFLGYSEHTMDLPELSGYSISNPTTQYGTEAALIIAPPSQSLLPSNCYILQSLRWRVDVITADTEIFADWQLHR